MSHGLTTDAPLTRAALLDLRERPAHVIGAASAEGVAVLRLLLALGFTEVTVHDMRPRAELRKGFRTNHGAFSRVEQDEIWESLAPALERGRFGDEYLTGMDDAALVSLGQGWYLDPGNRARIVDAVPAGALVTSMVTLYATLHRGPIAAITGTNGKSTTVAIAEALLEAAGVPFRASGNERSSRQFLPEIDDVPAGTWALLETSNRQLLQLASSPQVAAITALTPDHLEEHGGFEGYRDTKARLFERQNAEHDVAIANADDAGALELALRSPAAANGRLVRCGIGDHPAPSVTWRDGVLVADGVPLAQDGVRDHTNIIATEADLQLPGEHNLRNAAVAVALALACGADPARLAPALRAFEGKALRLQQLDTIDGVEVWSDIKSTTPEATVAALRALADRRVWLIAGGDDKGLDYGPLASTIVAGQVHAFAVPGTATDALAAALGQLDDGAARLELVDGLPTAFETALDRAASGDVVIVSPAAAGFWTRELQGGTSLRSLVRSRVQAVRQEVPER